MITTLNDIQQNGISQSGLGRGFGRSPRGVSSFGRGPSAANFGQAQVSQAQSQFQPLPQTVPTQFPNALGQVNPQAPTQTGSSTSGSPSGVPGQPGQVGQPNFIIPASARVTADPSTNSIIVIGDRSTQEIFKDLIDFLDKRRPQVMIECRVVVTTPPTLMVLV